MPAMESSQNADPQAVDEGCRRQFEQAWSDGNPRPISAFLPDINVSTLEELACIDMEFAWRRWAECERGVPRQAADAPPPPLLVEDYLVQFPMLDCEEILLRLIEQENSVRRRFGMAPAPGEFRRRFPSLDAARLGFDPDAKPSAGTEKLFSPDDVTWKARPWQEESGAAAEGLADYRIVREIGRGGMGVVYEAEQISLHRRVALKVLPTPYSGALEMARLRREAQAAAQFEHPHIIPIYEVGEHHGQPFFSMRLIEGGSLAKRLEAGPLPEREAAQLLIPVCRAMAAAHRGGLIHRDLKPSNILLDREAGPMIADFGLARFAESPLLTASDSIIGTPGYMPPEQAGRQGRAMSPSGDIYGLGSILYHMLTGRPPFQGSSPMETVLMVLEDDPLPPRLINPRIHPDLEAITLRCLQKQSARRYPTADALADDLESFLENKPVAVGPGGIRGVLMRRLRRETRYARGMRNRGREWMFHGSFTLGYVIGLNILQLLGASHGWIFVYMMVCLAVFVAILVKIHPHVPDSWLERVVGVMGWSAALTWLGMFLVEWVHGIPPLTFAPVSGVINSGYFLTMANLISGKFYRWSLLHLLGAVVMVVIQFLPIPNVGLTLHGILLWASFYYTGREYHRQAIELAQGEALTESNPPAEEIPTVPVTTGGSLDSNSIAAGQVEA
jgi:serine/threonine-protein kinase